MSRELTDARKPGPQIGAAARAYVSDAAEALETCGPGPADVHSAIHDARRTLKRARALLRFARAFTEADSARALAVALREAGRMLAPARDQRARLEALDRLVSSDPRLDCDEVGRLRRRWCAAAEAVAPAPEALLTVARRLRQVEVAMEALHLRKHGSPRSALKRIHHRGKRALHGLLHEPGDPARYHELRKRAKELRHVLEFMAPAWPPVLGAWAAEAHRLTDLLGEANDIGLVLEGLDGDPSEAVWGVLLSERDRRWHASLPLARRIWADRPGAFAKRVTGILRAWSSDAVASGEGSSAEPSALRRAVSSPASTPAPACGTRRDTARRDP